MAPFSLDNKPESVGNFWKTFFFRSLGEFWIHMLPFMIFASGCRLQVLHCVSLIHRIGRIIDGDVHRKLALETFEQQFPEPLCVFFFVVSCFDEDIANLLVAFFVRNRRIICVPVAGLPFSSKSLKQILGGFGSLQALHLHTSL